MLSDDGTKITELTYRYDLEQNLCESTHYTEFSSALIRLIFNLRDPANVLYNGVVLQICRLQDIS